MHRQKQKLLLQILQTLQDKRDFALTLIEIVKNPETSTTIFDMILEFINRARWCVDLKTEVKIFLSKIKQEIAF